MNRKAIAITVATLLGAGGLASAQAAGNDGWYGGLDLGRSNQRLGGGQIDSALGQQGLTTSSSMDEHATAWGLFAGYQFNPYFAVEGGYVNLGKFDYSSTASAPAADTVTGHFGVQGVDAAAVGLVPFGARQQWAAYGKAGLLYAKSTLDASSTGAVAASDADHWSTSPLLGAGINYDLTRNVALRAEYDRYFKVGDATVGKGDIDAMTARVVYRFQ